MVHTIKTPKVAAVVATTAPRTVIRVHDLDGSYVTRATVQACRENVERALRAAIPAWRTAVHIGRDPVSVNTLTLRVLRDPTMVMVRVKETARVARKHARAVASFDGAGRAPMALGMRGTYASESPRHTTWSFPASTTKPEEHTERAGWIPGPRVELPLERVGTYRDLHGGVGRFMIHRHEPVRSVARFIRKPKYVKLYSGLRTTTRTRIAVNTTHEAPPAPIALATETRTRYRAAVKLGVLAQYHEVISIARV